MKFNWGTGIAVFYGAFMVLMITFVVKSRSVDHSLVMENYYEEDLQYQDHINKVANSNALDADLVIKKTDDKYLDLVFPEVDGQITGEVWFYKPNDSRMDFKVPVAVDDTRTQSIPTGSLVAGLWRIKVGWQAGKLKYYKEQEVYL